MGKTEVAEEGSDEKQGVEKVWTSAIGRAETDTDEKKIYSKELKNVAKPKKTEGKKCKKVLDKYIPFTWHERLFTFKGKGMR